MTIAIRKEDAENKPLYEFASWVANTQKKAYPKRWRPIFEKYGVTPQTSFEVLLSDMTSQGGYWENSIVR